MASAISKTTVRALLDLLSDGWTIRTIENLFIDAGIAPVPPEDAPIESGQRRTAARQYIHSLDLSKPRDCARLLPVFDEVLGDLQTWDGQPDTGRLRLLERLRRDGFDRDPSGKLRATSSPTLAELPVTGTEEEVLREHLERLERGLVDDPAAAIGASKDLIESVCKLVLVRLDIEHDTKADVPVLVKTTLKSLKLHPDALAPTGQASDAVKRILASLSSMAVGVAELRNELGTGHGRAAVRALSARHAHLATGAATTFARFVLETLEDPNAPWRRP